MYKIILITLTLLLSSCFEIETPPPPKDELLIYCGITMVKPIAQLAKEFEKQENIKIHITQGGSQNLYNALKTSKTGDLYIPGSNSYRTNNKNDALLEEYKLLGYNRLALIVQKGNPLKIDNNITNLINPKLRVVLGDKDFGSVGRAAYKLLTKAKIKDKVYNNALYLTTDSRRITNALKNNEADLTLNWYATSFWNENKDLVTALELSKNIAKPKAIEVNLLKFSHNKNLARKFIDFASSSYGKEVFYNYGFFTPEEYKNQK